MDGRRGLESLAGMRKDCGEVRYQSEVLAKREISSRGDLSVEFPLEVHICY